MINTHRDARHPFEVIMVPVAGIAGFLQLVTGQAPSNIAAAASPAVQILWSLLVLVGSIICTTGILWRDEATGLYLEIAGLVGIAFGLMAYALSIFIVSQAPLASFAAPFCLAFSAACFWRCWQCIRVIYKAVIKADQAVKRAGRGET